MKKYLRPITVLILYCVGSAGIGYAYGVYSTANQWAAKFNEHLDFDEMMNSELRKVLDEQSRLVTIGEWISVPDTTKLIYGPAPMYLQLNEKQQTIWDGVWPPLHQGDLIISGPNMGDYQ